MYVFFFLKETFSVLNEGRIGLGRSCQRARRVGAGLEVVDLHCSIRGWAFLLPTLLTAGRPGSQGTGVVEVPWWQAVDSWAGVRRLCQMT